jgi:hypothetical protein
VPRTASLFLVGTGAEGIAANFSVQGSLSLSALTLLDGAATLIALATSAGGASLGGGGVTLADAQGATLGRAAGAFPGDVRLTQLTAAGQVAFGARAANATLSRDAHGALAASFGVAADWAGMVNNHNHGLLALHLPRGASTIAVAVSVGSGQRARVVGAEGSTLAFGAGVAVATGGSLALEGPLTLRDGVAALWALATSAGGASLGGGGVTLADAQGVTLGRVAGAFPGDVRLTQLTAAGQAAFGARAANATLSRDAHGALTASGMPSNYFVRASGPCELSQGGRCARRGRYDLCAGEQCDLVVGWGGALGACPTFDLSDNAPANHLTVSGTQYTGTARTPSPYPGIHRHCPQGAQVAAGATITWDVTPLGCRGHHYYRDGWEICF